MTSSSARITHLHGSFKSHGCFFRGGWLFCFFNRAAPSTDAAKLRKYWLARHPYFSNESLLKPKTSSEKECLCLRKKKGKKRHSNIYCWIMKIVMILLRPSSYCIQAQMALNWLAKGARGLFFPSLLLRRERVIVAVELLLWKAGCTMWWWNSVRTGHTMEPPALHVGGCWC